MREMFSAVFSIAVTAAVAMVGGAIGAVIFARFQDEPLRVQVLDMRRIVQQVAEDPVLDEAGRRIKVQQISDAMSKFAREQAGRGVIILDGSAVLQAPPQAYVEP
jgi:hypothetical protein